MKAWLKHAARALAGASVVLSLAAAAWAQSADVVAPIQAHPAIWTVHGPSGTAYLLGSIHVLPPQMRWRTPEIGAALDASDVFVFEVPMDDSQKEKVQDFVKDNGLLPPGMALPSMLNEQERKDYTAAIALTHVPPELLTPMRPWLALLTLNAGFIEQQHLSPASGLDRQVYAFAQKKDGVSFRAFETAEQQLRLLMPQDKKLEMQEFDAGLKDLLTETKSVHELVDAWARGDVNRLSAVMNAGFKGNREAEKALFEDRNRAWVASIEKMLGEKHTYFITVGAGHLAGPKGVPAALRREGYKVDGP
jgi:uncharacterized protein YbaP (TraB family)